MLKNCVPYSFMWQSLCKNFHFMLASFYSVIQQWLKNFWSSTPTKFTNEMQLHWTMLWKLFKVLAPHNVMAFYSGGATAAYSLKISKTYSSFPIVMTFSRIFIWSFYITLAISICLLSVVARLTLTLIRSLGVFTDFKILTGVSGTFINVWNINAYLSRH